MEPIDEETQIGGEQKISFAGSTRSRKIRDGFLKRKSVITNSGDDLSPSIRSNSSDEIDDDERSNGSRDADEKRKKKRLGGLMQGFSRTTLFKFGSKMSIDSSRCSTRRNNIGKSPPPGIARSIPGRLFSLVNERDDDVRLASRSRISTMKHSRASSSQSIDQEPAYEMDDTLRNVESLPTEESSTMTFNEHVNSANPFPPRNADNFTSSMQIDVPPALKEEPEPEGDNSGSDSNTLPKDRKSKTSSTSINLASSQTPLIPPELET